MNDFVAGAVRLLLRVVVIAIGLALFASLLVAALMLALVWALRAGWARITGQPVTPWVMRMDPRSGFSTVFRSTERWSSGRRGAAPAANDTTGDTAASRRGGILPGAAEITDVQAREVR